MTDIPFDREKIYRDGYGTGKIRARVVLIENGRAQLVRWKPGHPQEHYFWVKADQFFNNIGHGWR